MNKMTKYFLLILASFSLIVSSCNNLEGEADSKDPVYINLEDGYAYISVGIDDASTKMISRTIVPTFATDYSGFKKFELTGTMSDNTNSFSRTFVSSDDPEQTAYEALTSARIPLPLLNTEKENWTFTLTGFYAGTAEESATMFFAQKEVELAGGLQEINFELKRNSAYNFESDATGKIEYSLSFTGSTVQNVSVTVTNVSDSENPVSNTFSVNAGSASVSFESLLPGKYTVDMTFLAADNVVVGKRQEIAYVIPNLTSDLEGSESAIDVDATHTITYKNGENNFAGFRETPVSTFSRHNEVTLPVTSDFTDAFNSEWTFLGWYKSSDFEGNPVSSIPKNTCVVDLTLYGKFVHKNEVPTVTDFAFTSDSLKVGHKITATPKAGESEFLGTITSWKWYYGSGDDWTEITDGITKTDANPATDSVAAVSTLEIKPDYAQKKLKVEAVQKYSITESAVSGVFNIADNSTSVSKETDSVSKGQLAVGTIVLSYKDIIVRETALQNRFEIKEGSLTDAKSTGWTYDSNKVSLSYNTESGKMAPSASNMVSGIPISFSVSGYETFTPNMSVFIKVKYAAPTTTSDVPATVPSLHENEYEVTYDYLKFDSSSEYVQYKVDSGDWANITTSEFKSGTLLVRYKENSSQGNEGEADYIYASDSFTLSTDGHVGKKVLLSSVKYEEGDSNFKVTGNIIAEATPTYTGTGIDFVENGYGTIVWEWYAVDDSNSEELIWTDTNNHSARSQITITEQRRTLCYDKKIRVKAAYTYNKQEISVINKETTSSKIGKGDLDVSDVTLSYQGSEEQGAALSTSKLSISGVKNSNGESVSVETSNLSFESPNAPDSTGDVNVKINVRGYNEAQKAVQIQVRKAAPAMGLLTDLLWSIPEYVQIGHIRFASENTSFEWAYVSSQSGIFGDWHDIDPSYSFLKVDEEGEGSFYTGAVIAIRWKAAPGTVASTHTPLVIEEANVGTRMARIEIEVQSEMGITLSKNGDALSALGIPYGKECKWFIDDVEQSVTEDFFPFDTSDWVTGSYSIRVESTNLYGESISATATVVITKD